MKSHQHQHRLESTQQGLGDGGGPQSGASKRALTEDALKDTLKEGKEATEAAVFAFENVGCNQEKAIPAG